MPNAPSSSAELIDLLQKSGIASPEKLAGVSDQSLPADPQKAAAVLVGQGVVTRFQAQQLLAGRHKGFRIGPYVILDLLGRGGMGAVYLGEHRELRRKVAVKVLVPGRDEDQKLAVERFQREARSAAALDHPNIVRLFDVSRQGETPYLVMEFVEGETLQQILDRDGAIPFPVATEYVAQAAAGLQHAHEKGFVHRDIKPANMIRDRNGTVKILDMGLARSDSSKDKLTEQLDNGAVVGTADFIAPEQGMNQAVDVRADIYSLGATFFALVTGKPPFEGNTTQKLLQHQLKSPPSLSSVDATLPKGLGAVVARMLAKKPADRYQTPAEVIAALAPWLGSSARVIAGLSRTNLAQGADLQAALAEIALGGSARRLAPPRLPGVNDSGEVNPSQAARETGAVAGAVTTRDSPRTKESVPLAPANPSRKKIVRYAGIGAAVLAAVVIGWLAFGGKKQPDAVASDTRPRSEQEGKPKDEPKPNPVPNPNPNPPPKKNNPVPVTPKVDPPRELAVYRFDPADLAAFRVRLKSGAVVDGKRGTFPQGVAIYALKPDTEAEFSAGPVDGTPALAITRFGPATGSQVAIELERETAAGGIGLKLRPDAEYRVRVRYRADAMTQIGVSVHTLAFKSAGYKTYGPTGGKWATAEMGFRRPADPVRLAVETLGAAETPVAIGAVELVEVVPAGTAGETVLFQMDLAGQKPFVVRSGQSVDPKDPTKKTYRFVSRSGPGEPPAGWTGRVWNKDTEMEYFAEEGAEPVLGIRNVSGPGAAMLFMPKFDCPTGTCRLRFEYSTNARDGKFIVRFKASDNRPAWDVVKPQSTGAAWRTEELDADLRGAAGGYFEFHNNDDNPDVALRLRGLVVTGPKTSARPDKVLFALDAADLPVFKNTKEGRRKTAGDDDPKVKGVYFGGWKPETLSEWDCGPVAGARAVGYAHTGEVPSAQIGLELESATGIGLKIDPGTRVRLRVVYRTAGAGRGSIYFQTYGDSKVPDRAALPNSNDEWKTVDVVTTRGERPLRCLIDNNVTGAGNTLYVRSVTVGEVGKGTPTAAAPQPNPPPADPNDPARWAEGPAVFALDVAKIPAFRVQKEKGTRLGGEAEQLPPGVGCGCWKEKGVGEFRCEKIDDVPALSVTNLNEEKSAQFYFDLEGGMKLQLQPGKAYRVKLGYMTRNEAAGNATVQVTPGYQGIASARLANTGGKWATAAVSFVRPAAEDKVEVRMVFDNSTVGEGNALCVRSLEIVELVPPVKK